MHVDGCVVVKHWSNIGQTSWSNIHQQTLVNMHTLRNTMHVIPASTCFDNNPCCQLMCAVRSACVVIVGMSTHGG